MAKWELGRFWQTLTYFELIPGINCWQKIFSGKSPKQTTNRKNMMILIAGATTEVGRRIVAKLLAENYQVRALVEDLDRARNILGDKVELWQGDLSCSETFSSTMMTGIDKLIYCSADRSLTEIDYSIQAISSYLPAADKLMLFDFTNPSLQIKETWGAVDDVVMGGVSQSNIRLLNNRAIFAGIVSTDNNGGFASVRTRNFSTPLDLSDYQGIQLKVKGDGKRYKFIARCEGKWDGVGYCYSFDTVYDLPTVVFIPFAELIPVFRAKTVSEAGQIDASKIYSMQLMLSKFEYDGELNPKFEAGSFALEVESIQAYEGKSRPQLILLSSMAINDPNAEEISRETATSLQNKGLTYSLIYYSQELELSRYNEISHFVLAGMNSPSAVNRITVFD